MTTYDELVALRDAVRQARRALQAAQPGSLPFPATPPRPPVGPGPGPVLGPHPVRALQAELDARESAYRAALDALPAGLDRRLPVALLPVRLETRLTSPAPDGSRILLVRVYPDDIHADTLEEPLTDVEADAGRWFWTQAWRAGADPTAPATAAAWQELVERTGASRAAWVARELTPTNPQSRPQKPVTDLVTGPDFPTRPSRTGRWTRAPRAAALPDRWMVLGYRDGARVVAKGGGLIERPLATGPDPSSVDDPFGTGIAWMVDFDAAVDAGMGIRVPLPAPVADRLDLLLVVGVRGTDSAGATTTELAGLLDAHHYTWGLDIVPFGTPTNNSADARSGWDPAGTAADELAATLGPPAAAGSDAHRLAAALGLASDGPLGRLAHAAEAGHRAATDMATALWPATWGYFLTQLMAPMFTDVDLAAWQAWVTGTVRGRGPLAALRVGDQPYGVLPVTSLAQWRPDPAQPELVTAYLRPGPGGAALRLGWDLGADGAWTGGWTGPFEFDAPAGAVSVDIDVSDVDRDGRPDLVVLVTEPARVTYRIGWRLGPDGPQEWADPVEITGIIPGPPVNLTGAAVAVIDLPAGPTAIIAPKSPARLATLPGIGAPPPPMLARPPGAITPRPPAVTSQPAVVVPLPADGTAPVAIQSFELPSPGPGWVLADIAAGELPGAGTAVALLWLLRDPAGDRAACQIGGPAPVPTGWGPLQPVPLGLGTVDAEVGIAFIAGRADERRVIVHAVWNADDAGLGSYVVGSVAATGLLGSWRGPFNTGGPIAGPIRSAAIGLADIGRWSSSGLATPSGRVNLLGNAAAAWRRGAAAVPRMGRTGDPDRDLLEVLTVDGLSDQVAARALIGPAVAEHLWWLAGSPLAADYRPAMRAAAESVLRAWGVPGEPRQAEFGYVESAVELDAPLVTSAPLSEEGLLIPDYLSWAAQATPDELHSGVGVTQRLPDEPLLWRLVRHATLQAYADAAMRLVPPPGGFLVEPELVDLPDMTQADPVTPPHTPTSWRYLSEHSIGGDPLAHVIRKLSDARDPRADEVTRVRDALLRLAQLPTAALQRLLMETLDLAGHRLDAWITTVATDRLAALRRDRPDGIQLGGFGFVTDLRPVTAPATTGFVHAPSLGHAATAAVLRSGHLTHAGQPAGGQLAVDLSAPRVRAAQELLDGVRDGRPLGTLLGARLERGLHDTQPALGLGQYLPALRQLAPAVAGKLTPLAGDPVTAVAAPSTLDGLALLTGRAAIPWGAPVPGQTGGPDLPRLGTPAQLALGGLLDDLAATVDAVADLGLAEGVHQILQGNPGRAAGSLDALSRGDLPPPEPEVVRTPRRGIGVTHRLAIVLPDVDTEKDEGLQLWVATAAQQARRVRARTEPRLNRWAARVLGDPGRVRWWAEYVDGTAIEFALADVGLCPLDILYAATVDPATPGSDLEHLLAWHAHLAGPGAPTTVRLDRHESWDPATLSVPELLEVARAARDLILHARPLTPLDLAAPGVAPGMTTADPVLADRVDQALADLRDAADALDAAADPDAVREALVGLAAFGIAGAAPVPDTDPDTDPDTAPALTDQARSIAAEARDRVTAAETASTVEERVAAVLGREFRVLPGFALPEPDTLRGAVATRAAAQDADGATVADWLGGVADVREGVARYATVRLYASAVGTALDPDPQVIQLPRPDPGVVDRWAALPLRPGERLLAGRLSIVVNAPFGLDLAGAGLPGVAGLLVDEWVEMVPSPTAVTAVTYHYDAPAAAAPQSVLLAVPPDPSAPWRLETLEAILLETVELMRIRATDPDVVPEVGHFVPALVLATNVGGDPSGDTIATQFPGA